MSNKPKPVHPVRLLDAADAIIVAKAGGRKIRIADEDADDPPPGSFRMHEIMEAIAFLDRLGVIPVARIPRLKGGLDV